MSGSIRCGKVKKYSSEKKYCGDKRELPPGYTRWGTARECLRSGFVAGVCNERKRLEEKFEIENITVSLGITKLKSYARYYSVKGYSTYRNTDEDKKKLVKLIKKKQKD